MPKMESTLLDERDASHFRTLYGGHTPRESGELKQELRKVKKGRRWERRQKTIAVFLCALTTLFEGINSSLAAPLFPDKAHEKGRKL